MTNVVLTGNMVIPVQREKCSAVVWVTLESTKADETEVIKSIKIKDKVKQERVQFSQEIHILDTLTSKATEYSELIVMVIGIGAVEQDK